MECRIGERERMIQSEGTLVQRLETRERVMALCGQRKAHTAEVAPESSWKVEQASATLSA